MAEDSGDYTAELPAGDLDALCTRIATCAVTMSPYEQLAVIRSFGMNPDSPEDMQILYTGVQIALSRIPREPTPSRSPTPDGDLTLEYINLPDDDDLQGFPENLKTRTIPGQNSPTFRPAESPDSGSSIIALQDVRDSLGKMQISQNLASKRNGMDKLPGNHRSSRAVPYVHKTTESAKTMVKRYTLNQNHIYARDGKEFIGEKQRNSDDPLVCLWGRSTCKAIIASGRDEDILAHLIHHHGFVISGAPILKQMCQWGEKCHIYVHDADMVSHIARNGGREEHCRFDEHRCKSCFKLFSNIDKLVGHAIRLHKGVVLY